MSVLSKLSEGGHSILRAGTAHTIRSGGEDVDVIFKTDAVIRPGPVRIGQPSGEFVAYDAQGRIYYGSIVGILIEKVLCYQLVGRR